MILLLVLASIGLTACTNNEEKLNDSEMFKKNMKVSMTRRMIILNIEICL